MHTYPMGVQAEFVIYLTGSIESGIEYVGPIAYHGGSRRYMDARIFKDLVATGLESYEQKRGKPYVPEEVEEVSAGKYDYKIKRPKGLIILQRPRNNKMSDWRDYTSQLPGGPDYRGMLRVPAKVEKTMLLGASDYDEFVTNFLADRGFLEGLGGFDEYKPDQYAVRVVEINARGRSTIYVDPQGHNYARYVLFPKDATASWTPVKTKAKARPSLADAPKPPALNGAAKWHVYVVTGNVSNARLASMFPTGWSRIAVPPAAIIARRNNREDVLIASARPNPPTMSGTSWRRGGYVKIEDLIKLQIPHTIDRSDSPLSITEERPAERRGSTTTLTPSSSSTPTKAKKKRTTPKGDDELRLYKRTGKLIATFGVSYKLTAAMEAIRDCARASKPCKLRTVITAYDQMVKRAKSPGKSPMQGLAYYIAAEMAKDLRRSDELVAVGKGDHPRIREA
jgi:hypothetical protein